MKNSIREILTRRGVLKKAKLSTFWTPPRRISKKAVMTVKTHCAIHKFKFVAMPRDPSEPEAESYGFLRKCPLNICGEGVLRAEDPIIADHKRVVEQRNFLLLTYVESPDGVYAFPDGAEAPCRKTVTPVMFEECKTDYCTEPSCATHGTV